MIHQIFNLTRPLIVPDVETTGLNPAVDRIVEIGFQIWTAEGLQKEWRSLVNPGIPIPPELTKIHHISDDQMLLCSKCSQSNDSHPTTECPAFHTVPTFEQLAPSLAKGFTNVDFMGKNVRFDLRVIAAEMARAHVPWSYIGARIIDADRLEQLGEPRTLSHLYKKHLGRDPVDAHQALADVRMTTEIVCAQMKRYTSLPRSLDQLHNLQWPGWIDDFGKFRFVNGVATCMFGKWRDRAMKDIDPGYYQWLLKADFPEDIKTLARLALEKTFPQEAS